MTTGTVGSNNLTSLYSNTTSFTTGLVNSSVYSVNGGLGVTVNPTTGNVVVSIGQDVATTANVQFANVTATGNLSNNYYTLANAVGTNGQVLTTNGAGVTTWTTPSSLGLVSSVTGSGAGITVSPTTGAVIVSNTGVTSIVAGSNISISGATGAVTISTVADNIPDGTARGQVLYWDGSAWTANSTISSAADANRLRVVYEDSSLGVTNALFVRKDYTTSTYTTGDGTGIGFQLDSNSQATNQLATISTAWDASAPAISLNTNINNNTAGPYVSVANFTSAQATLPGDLAVNGDTIKLNATGAAADNFIYFNGTNESLKWNQADSRFEFSDQLYITQTDVPAIFERRTLSADTSPYELKAGVKLINRVTDAANNDVVNTGPTVTFARTSGATATTERVFANMGSAWDGATNSAQLQFTWSNDNYSEPTPGNFPGTYTLLSLESNNSEFYNDSLYIDYSAQGSTDTATSIITSNTLVFGSAHGYSSGDRIQYTSTTQNGLTQNTYYYVLSSGLTATQCQLGLTSSGSAIALTNGTGLTLVFAELINQIGINTNTPNYTLDVNGEANVETTLTVPSITTLTGDDLNITAFSGRDVTISTTLATDPVTIVRNTAATGSGGIPVRALTLRVDSTGTPVVGFGSSIDFETETTPGTTVQTGYIIHQSTGDNAGVLDEFKMSFGVMSAGTTTTRMVLDNLGNLQIDNDLTVTGTNINTGVTDTIIQIDRTSSDTAIPTRALKLLSTSTGTPAVGFGTALGFQGQTAVSTFKDAAFIAVSSTDITSSNEDFIMSFGLMQNGATYDTKMSLNSAGDLTIDGILDTIRIDIDNQATIDTATLTTTATTTVPLLTSTRNAITGLVNIIQGANVHCVNVTILRIDATTAMLTTYGEMYNTTSLANFTADVSAGAVRLLITPTSATSTVFSAVRTSLT